MNNKWKKNPITGLIVICMGILAFLFIYPLFFVFINSFKDGVQYYANPLALPQQFNFQNYIGIIKNFGIFKFFGNTLILAVIGIPLNMAVSVMAAYAFARMEFRGKNVLYFVIIFSMFFPAQVTLIPLYVMFAKTGLLNTYVGMIFVTGTSLLPSTIMLLRANFSGLEKSLFEAAKIDGAGYFRVVWNILVPLAKPVLAISAIFNFLVVFNDLLRPMILLQKLEKRTLTVALATLMNFDGLDPSYIMAGMFISAVIPLIIYLVFSKYIVKGVSVGSIK